MSISVSSNLSETKTKFDKFYKSILRATERSLRDIEREIVRYVVDNRYWSSQAIYKSGPNVGKKYDLSESGRLLATIDNKDFNYIVRLDNHKSKVGIGNKEQLDAIKTERKNVKDPDFSYWRTVVYGRAAIQGWTFFQQGVKWGVSSIKPVGFAVEKDGKFISSSEPTHMFENGFFAAKSSFSNIITNRLKKVVNK